MKKKESRAERIASALDLPLDIMCDVPRTEILGRTSVNIENFRGILDYNENCVKVNTTVGILKIDGDGLFIESITDEGLTVKGSVIRLEFV